MGKIVVTHHLLSRLRAQLKRPTLDESDNDSSNTNVSNVTSQPESRLIHVTRRPPMHPLRVCGVLFPGWRSNPNRDLVRMGESMMDDLFCINRWNTSFTYVKLLTQCDEMITKNETDIIGSARSFSDIDSKYVSYTSLMHETRNKIISSFVPVKESDYLYEGTDFMTAFLAFNTDVVLLTLAFTLVFYVLFKSYSRMIRGHKLAMMKMKASAMSPRERIKFIKDLKRKTPPSRTAEWLMFWSILRVFCVPIDGKRWSFKLILLVYLGFVSGIHYWFAFFIRTELVIIDEPYIFDSNQKVLDHERTVMSWIRAHEYVTVVAKAPKGSMANRLWEKSKRLRCPVHELDCTEAISSVPDLQALADKVSKQDIVMQADTFIGGMLHAILCPLAYEYNLNPIIIREDPDETGRLLVQVYNRLMEQHARVIVRVIKKRASWTSNSGIGDFLVKPTQSAVEKLVQPINVKKCLLYPQETRTDRGSNILPKPLADFTYSAYTCLVMILIAALLLMTEKYLAEVA